MGHDSFEVEFRCKEQVVYWEGDRGHVVREERDDSAQPRLLEEVRR